MKITDLRTRIAHPGFRKCVLVTIEPDAGLTRTSETVMKRRTFTIGQSILQLRRYLIGRDSTEIEDHWESARMRERTRLRPILEQGSRPACASEGAGVLRSGSFTPEH